VLGRVTRPAPQGLRDRERESGCQAGSPSVLGTRQIQLVWETILGPCRSLGWDMQGGEVLLGVWPRVGLNRDSGGRGEGQVEWVMVGMRVRDLKVKVAKEGQE